MDRTQPTSDEPRFTPLALFLCALALLAVVGMFAAADLGYGLGALIVAGGVWFVASNSRVTPVGAAPEITPVAAPTGQSSVTLNSPGPRPDDVIFVWRHFRALDPSEKRTPDQLYAELGSGVPVLLASGVKQRWADDFAEALRRAGADVQVH